MLNTSFWSGKKVLITGHTGFKGSWLSLWLQKLNATILGYALSPDTSPNLYAVGGVANNMQTVFADIRDFDKLATILKTFQPEIIFHLAAQPLVRESYLNPVETYTTNINGTLNLLEAVRSIDSVKVVVNVTTDKCYDNKEDGRAYQEMDALGGFDPYSSSKACSELISATYRNSFYQSTEIALATARAGNVIGGGDWTKDRIIPDCIRSFEENIPLVLRYPNAIRPWQHVLVPLSGYLLLAEKLYADKSTYEGAWNFGPSEADVCTVGEMVKLFSAQWPTSNAYSVDNHEQFHEASLLTLDSTKAYRELGWRAAWSLDETLMQTINWYKQFSAGQNMHDLCLSQITEYESSLVGASIV